MPSSVLKQLFPNVKISKMKSRISTYGSQTMKPKGQVTLVCERKGRLHTTDFLVLNVSGDKPSQWTRRTGLKVLDHLCRRDKRSRGDHTKLATPACTWQINFRGHSKPLLQCFQTRTQETSWEPNAHRLGSVRYTRPSPYAPRSSGKISYIEMNSFL